MRIWVDLTNSPHVLVMRPVIRALEARGDRVLVTARDFAQTLGLCERLGLAHEAIGHHRGGRLAAKGLGLASRSLALANWAKGRRFDVALGHGSNDITVAAKLLGIPSATTFDYEWATVQHTINCRLARRVVVPDAIPPERLARYGAGPDKLRRYPGLKEEYYLADFAPDPAVLDELGLDPAAPLAVVRTPPAVSLYHRFEHPLFGAVLRRLREQAQVVVLPRTPEQRAALAAEGGYVVPERAIDAQSLIAYADLVVSAGGTMNREAVALGAPVWTTFEGRLGAVDERLIAEGRLRRLAHAEEITVAKRAGGTADDRVRRDPGVLANLLTGAPGEENCPRAGSMPGCAGGSAPRPPSRFIATASPRWPWTLGWSRSPISSPTSSASTERFPRSIRICSSGRSPSSCSAACSCFRCSGSTGTGCATRRSASTCRSARR